MIDGLGFLHMIGYDKCLWGSISVETIMNCCVLLCNPSRVNTHPFVGAGYNTGTFHKVQICQVSSLWKLQSHCRFCNDICPGSY